MARGTSDSPKEQASEVYMAFEDSDSESDIEIDLVTKPAKKVQPKVPKHFRKSNAQVYDNISVYAPPDSNLIFRCSQKRANWYLSRDLARSLSPTSIHLNFAPAGQGRVNDPYHLEERENKCVICGEETAQVGATMLHVVPEQYRKWFPIRLKSHSSHDIVVACPECNAHWDREAAIVRKKIVKLYNIPLEGIGWIKDHDAGVAKRSAGAVITDWNRQWNEYREQQSMAADVKNISIPTQEAIEESTQTESSATQLADLDTKPKRKMKAKKQNVIPPDRLKVLEKSVYDWWISTQKEVFHNTRESPALKRDLTTDDDEGSRKKIKPEVDTGMDASPGTTIPVTPPRTEASNSETPKKSKDASSSIDVPMPPPGHSTQLDRTMLEAALSAQASYRGPDYMEHGQLVVARIMASSLEYYDDADESQGTIQAWKDAVPLVPAPEGWRNVGEFIRTWRWEFLQRIQPKHLSAEWKVENPV
ncbi:hypothetical protein BGZ54_000351 [Gamsiella multidivaricata]|nr:hypothetical protein BGZ54_000351 [Gamsiella multidivaricata]